MVKYLIVDDEPLIRRGIIKLISRAAPEAELCAEAWNGKEGLELVDSLRPEIILTDIRMPEMDGLAMTNHLIDQAFSIPVVFITGHDEFAYIQQAIKNNAFDYLLKPIKETDVRELFDRYNREYGVKNKLEQKDISKIKMYEFYLLNVLESQNAQRLGDMENWYIKLEGLINLRSFIDLTVRTVSSYLLKYNIVGAEFKPVINETNPSNVIQKLQEYCGIQLEEAKNQNTNKIIKQVQDWVGGNIRENLSLSEAAELVHMNTTYFSEYFKKTTGETFSQYVIRCKVEQAKVYLADYSLRVYDVADKVGYTDHRHFSKLFHKKVGMTPTEYRNKVLGTGEKPSL